MESVLPWLVGQRGDGQDSQRKMEDVCGLHRPKQGLSQGQLSSPEDWHLSRLNSKTPATKFHGYNQIKLDKTNQEKTSFITSQGFFCYKVMLFGLKNVGATYQRLMNKMFAQQIGRNVQVYIDDMLVKSKWEDDHLTDLQETFDTLWSYNMKLNPSKCAFGVTARKFLGFMVS